MANERQRLSDQSVSSRSGWNADRLAKFWTAMKGLYGQRWCQSYGDEIDVVWEGALKDMTVEAAACGWRACRDSGDTHPVTLPVFLARVKAGRPVLPLGGYREDPSIRAMHEAAARQAQKELPAPDKCRMERLRSADNIAEAALAELRDILPKRALSEERRPVVVDFPDQFEPVETFKHELAEWRQGNRPKTWQAEK